MDAGSTVNQAAEAATAKGATMAGYTHRVHFTLTKSSGALAGLPLLSDFRTTANAVELSVAGLRARADVSDVWVEVL